jgi:hypothetical protein
MQMSPAVAAAAGCATPTPTPCSCYEYGGPGAESPVIEFKKAEAYYDWNSPQMNDVLGRVEVVMKKETSNNQLPVDLDIMVVCKEGKHIVKIKKITVYYANEVDPDGKPPQLVPVEILSSGEVQALLDCLEIYTMGTGLSKYYSRDSLVAHENGHAIHIPTLVSDPSSKITLQLGKLEKAVSLFRYSLKPDCSPLIPYEQMIANARGSATVLEEAKALVRVYQAELVERGQHDHDCSKVGSGLSRPEGVAVVAEQQALRDVLVRLCGQKNCVSPCPEDFSVCHLLSRGGYSYNEEYPGDERW